MRLPGRGGGLLCALLLWTFSLSAGSAAHAKSDEVERWSRELMGTRVDILVYDGPDDIASHVEAAFELMQGHADELSEWRSDSPVSKISQGAGTKTPLSVSEDVMHVLETGQEISRRSRGAFDMTWAAMMGLWDFKADPFVIPSAKARRERAKLVDYRQLVLNKKTMSARLKQSKMRLGLGGIAKGYVVEKGIAFLEGKGVKHLIISAGGDLAARGTRGERNWRSGIQHPRKNTRLLGTVDVRNAAIVTSGDYERYRVLEGKRYHHILDPKTAMPVTHTQSCTVLAPNAMLADALSTAAFVLGPKKGLALLKASKGVEGLIVDAKGKQHMTAGMKSRFWPIAER